MPAESKEMLGSYQDPTGTVACHVLSSNADDSQEIIEKPMNPTPPRTRRGSSILNKSRQQRKKKSGTVPKQRARSNSVPTVSEWIRFSTRSDPMATKHDLDEEPGDHTDDTRSYKFRSCESLLIDDVVEGFSWTMAESVIESGINQLKDRLRVTAGSSSQQSFRPCKGILKNAASNDSLSTFYDCETTILADDHDIGNPFLVSGPDESILLGYHRSNSMPSLRTIDELDPALNKVSSATDRIDPSIYDFFRFVLFSIFVDQ